MVERKYLAHFIDAAFDTTFAATNYVRLGKDLEEYNEELNPDVETTKNILGEQSVKHNGYEVQADVDPFYYDYDEALAEKIMSIVNERSTGDKCKTSILTVLLDEEGAVKWAYREDCMVIPTSVGGDTAGIQTPFSVYMAGNRTKGTFVINTKKFTPDESL